MVYNGYKGSAVNIKDEVLSTIHDEINYQRVISKRDIAQ